MPECIDSLKRVAQMARDQPVLSQFSDLAARILRNRHGIEVIDGYDTFCSRFESPTHLFSGDVVIRGNSSELDLDRNVTTYSPPPVLEVNYTGTPYSKSLNQWVSEEWLSWKDVQETTLCQSAVSDKIIQKGARADVIAYVVVDGLSFEDWTAAGYDAVPVYVDCPTITECGYPNAVRGSPDAKNLATRLYSEGYENRFAFTYWEKENNDLTEKIHEPFSPNDVVGDITGFDDVASYLQSEDWYGDRSYLQITLTGPERVAHQMKEQPLVESEVTAVYDKLRKLQSVLEETAPSFRIFATADHGMLWRMHGPDRFDIADGDWKHYMRRCIERSETESELNPDQGKIDAWGNSKYLRLYYPYLFDKLKSNEPGTHGGFSYEESIVPFIEMS